LAINLNFNTVTISQQLLHKVMYSATDHFVTCHYSYW